MPLLDLYRSFTDQWVLFDSVEAATVGDEPPVPSLQSFDADHARQHGAGFRSLAAAIEDLDLDSIDDEIDRTILLAAVRTRLHRVDQERPERVNPALWCHRLAAVVAARPGEADTLARIPGWAEGVRGTIAKPPLVHLEVALGHLAQARALLESESWWQSDKDALSLAIAGVENVEQFLRHEVEPDPDPAAGAIGEVGVEWRLRLEHLLPYSGERAAGLVAKRIEVMDRRMAETGVGDAESRDLVERFTAAGGELVWGPHGSEIRRRLLARPWAHGWLLFEAASGESASRRTAAAVFGAGQARLGGIDLGIQLGRMTPSGEVNRMTALGTAESGSLAAIGDLLLDPLAETATTLLAAGWEEVRSRWSGDDSSFLAAVADHGLYHPTLAAWKLGLDG